jgi:hypothetical protein
MSAPGRPKRELLPLGGQRSGRIEMRPQAWGYNK